MRCWLGVLLFLIPSLTAADTCRTLVLIAQRSENGFLHGPPAKHPADATDCSLSRNRDGTQTYLCYWQFAYRDGAAAAKLDTLNTDVQTCLTDLIVLPADARVNHPDSYDLRRYRRGNAIIALSLKDKAALGQSLVFLRVVPAAN